MGAKEKSLLDERCVYAHSSLFPRTRVKGVPDSYRSSRKNPEFLHMTY